MDVRTAALEELAATLKAVLSQGIALGKSLADNKVHQALDVPCFSGQQDVDCHIWKPPTSN